MMAEAKEAQLRVQQQQQQSLDEKENQQAHVQPAELARQSLHAEVETLRATLTTDDTRGVPRTSRSGPAAMGTPRASDQGTYGMSNIQGTQQVSNSQGVQRISDAQGVQRASDAHGAHRLSDTMGARRASGTLAHAETRQVCEDITALRGLLLATRQEAEQGRCHSQNATKRLEELETQFQATIERAEHVLQGSDVDQLRQEVHVMRGALASLQHDVLLAGLEARAARAAAAAAAAAAPGLATASPPPVDSRSGYTAMSIEEETRLHCSQKLAEKREALARWEHALRVREQALEEQPRPAVDRITRPAAASFSCSSTFSTGGGSGVPPMSQSAWWRAQSAWWRVAVSSVGWLGRLLAGCPARRPSAQYRAW